MVVDISIYGPTFFRCCPLKDSQDAPEKNASWRIHTPQRRQMKMKQRPKYGKTCTTGICSCKISAFCGSFKTRAFCSQGKRGLPQFGHHSMTASPLSSNHICLDWPCQERKGKLDQNWSNPTWTLSTWLQVCSHEPRNEWNAKISYQTGKWSNSTEHQKRCPSLAMLFDSNLMKHMSFCYHLLCLQWNGTRSVLLWNGYIILILFNLQTLNDMYTEFECSTI